MRVSDEPQGGPLEATTPPATAGEWRVTPWPDRGYSELHLGPLPTNRKSFGTTRFTVGPPSKAQQLADVLNRRDHNAASRLRIAEEKAALADEKWSRPIESDGFRTFCYECGADMSTNRLNLSGPVIPEHEAGCLKARYDALKGSSHE